MIKNIPISLGSHFEDFVESKINEGRFKNVGEVIMAGLRLLEEEENKIIALRNAIKQGIESGIDPNFEPTKNLEKLKARKKLNG